jgi:hypothetical protein
LVLFNDHFIIKFYENYGSKQYSKKNCTFAKNKKMVVEVKEITQDCITNLLSKMKRRKKKTLAHHFGKLKRGIDGLEYQKIIRNEWN